MSRTIRVRHTLAGMRRLAKFIDEHDHRDPKTPVEVALSFDNRGRLPSELVISIPTLRRRARTHFV
jgi:hypothetical protein